MTDKQIQQYLINHNYKVNARDFLMNVINTSPQIVDELYDSKNRMMTIITPDNEFTFKWVLREL